MTAIEEKARDFASEFSSQRSLIYGFEKGAEWMMEKAVEWFRHQKEEIGISWFDDYEIRFRKAMEEE